MRRTLTTALLDSAFALHVPDELAGPLEALLPAARGRARTAEVEVEVQHSGSGYSVRGQGRTSVGLDASSAVTNVLEICNSTAVEQCADFAVHAGVVQRGDRVVALPAASGVGKTTLVAALLRQGWSYVSDEGLVLTGDGAVRPYLKWLSLHRWTLERLGLTAPGAGQEERPAAAAELGEAVSAQARLRLTDVVLPMRHDGPAAMDRLPRAVAAVELLRYSFNHYRDPPASVELVSTVARDCSAWSLSVGDPVEAAALLTTTLRPR